MSKQVASALAVGAALASSCGGGAAPAKRPPIKIGIISAFTGRQESLGQGERFAAQLAVTEVNASGGLLDSRFVELVTADDAHRPEQGRREIARLIDQEQIAAFVGPVGSSVARALLEVSVPRQVPNISCCATSDALNTASMQSERERYFFRTIPPDSYQAPVVARAAVECFACQSLALFHRNDDYGNPFAEAVVREFEARQGSVVYEVAYDPEAASYKNEVMAAAAASPDCAVMIAYAGDGAHLRRDWETYARLDVPWIATEGIIDSTFVELLGTPSLADNLLVTAPVFDPVNPRSQAFKTAYEASFGRPPNAYNAQVFDGAALLLLAIAQAGSLEGRAIRDALFDVSAPAPGGGDQVVGPGELADGLSAILEGRGINYEGASGSVDFEDFGNVRSDYEIYKFEPSGEPRRVGLVTEDGRIPCPAPGRASP